MEGRETIKCQHCKLVQFRTKADVCRRCKESTAPPEPEPVLEIPEPVVFPVGTAEELARAVQLTLTVRRGKISQRKLAGRMGVVRTYLTKIEGGKVMPTLDTLEKFARGFEIPLWLLIMEIETMRAMLTEARKEQAL